MIDRPAVLSGATYKIKAPHIGHAIYVTINAEGGRLREVFVNSKAVEDLAWMTLALRELSQNLAGMSEAEIDAKVEDWKSAFDPKHGGYIMLGTGGQRCLGVQSHIGFLMERHMRMLRENN